MPFYRVDLKAKAYHEQLVVIEADSLEGLKEKAEGMVREEAWTIYDWKVVDADVEETTRDFYEAVTVAREAGGDFLMHRRLHDALDQLLAVYAAQTGKRPLTGGLTVAGLLAWSSEKCQFEQGQ